MKKEFKDGLLEHAEETGRISMASIPDGQFKKVTAFLEAEGYVCSLSPNTDYLMVEKA